MRNYYPSITMGLFVPTPAVYIYFILHSHHLLYKPPHRHATSYQNQLEFTLRCIHATLYPRDLASPQLYIRTSSISRDPLFPPAYTHASLYSSQLIFTPAYTYANTDPRQLISKRSPIHSTSYSRHSSLYSNHLICKQTVDSEDAG